MELSSTLILLLKAAKSDNPPLTWASVKQVLSELYSEQATLHDVIYLLTKSYKEALAEPRFQLKAGDEALSNLLLSPINSVSLGHEKYTIKSDTQITVDEFYNRITQYLINELRFSNKGWLPKEYGI